MASITITINDPTLGVGEKFIERHRLLPSGAFSSFVDRTNSSFTLTGLSDGTYQIEIAFVKADGTVCPSIFRTVEVVSPIAFTCPTFTVTQVGSPNRLKVEYTGGTGTPPCGFKVQYSTGGGIYSSVNYATLPTSPFYITVAPNTGLAVRIIADQCNGSTICFEGDVAAPPVAPCTGLGELTYKISPLEGNPQGGNRTFQVVVTAASQSTIPTTSVVVNASQTNVVAPSVRWSSAIPISGISPTLFTFTTILTFNHTIGLVPVYYWQLSFLDACGKLQFIKIQYP